MTKKPTPKPKPPPPRPKPEGNPASLEIRRIGDLMETGVFAAMNLPRAAPRIVTDGGQPQGFMSGRWHRRSGAIYANVALRGSPNAGNIHGDHPTGTVPPAIKRRG